jgi:spore maturation protein SpmB
MVDMFEQHGPDSFLGMTASIMMGSTETTFYVLTVYYGAVQIKKIRHTLAACLWTDIVAVTAAIIFGYLFYGSR